MLLGSRVARVKAAWTPLRLGVQVLAPAASRQGLKPAFIQVLYAALKRRSSTVVRAFPDFLRSSFQYLSMLRFDCRQQRLSVATTLDGSSGSNPRPFGLAQGWLLDKIVALLVVEWLKQETPRAELPK